MEDGRRRRTETTLQVRKEKKEDQISKRRQSVRRLPLFPLSLPLPLTNSRLTPPPTHTNQPTNRAAERMEALVGRRHWFSSRANSNNNSRLL